jgi:ferritin-like protein
MSHEGYHEPFELLPESVRNLHRGFVSVMEELEAVDWYYQRAAVTTDEALKAIVLHNAHEELEHAAMTIEWLRRNDPVFDAKLRAYLFVEGDISAKEEDAKKAIVKVADVSLTRGESRVTLGSMRDAGGGP